MSRRQIIGGMTAVRPRASGRCRMLTAVCLVVGVAFSSAYCRGAESGATAPETKSARAIAPVDLSGYWVSVVTQDWRFRMTVPGKGEYAGIPINERAKAAADAFDGEKEEKAGHACDAYGAGLVMRNPGRLHITWEDENTLRVEADAGQQTRLLRFGQSPPGTVEASRQGRSTAKWQIHQIVAPFGPPIRIPGAKDQGYLQVSTDSLLPGLLRKNGVPYGSRASMNEYWEVYTMPGGRQLLVLSSRFSDPEYLREDYMFNPIFVKEPDGSKWSPTPCSLRW
jgi:hypothetical protein